MEGHATGSRYPVRHTPGYPQTLMAHANYKLTLQYFNLSLGLWKEKSYDYHYYYYFGWKLRRLLYKLHVIEYIGGSFL